MFGQHRIGVLGEARRLAAQSAGRAREFYGSAERPIPVQLGVHLAMRRMGRSHRFIDGKHRPGRQARAQQPVRDLVPVLPGEGGGQNRHQRGAVDQPVLVGAEARIVGQLRQPQHGGELAELSLVARGDEDLAGAGRVFLIRRDVRVRVAERAGPAAVEEPVGGVRMQQRHAAIVQRHVEELPAPRPRALVQRHQDADDGKEARRQIDDRRAEPHGTGRRIAVHAHQPGHRLKNGVVAGQAPERPVGAEARDAAMDQAREVRRQRVRIAEAPFLHRAGLEVLHQHVGRLRAGAAAPPAPPAGRCRAPAPACCG